MRLISSHDSSWRGSQLAKGAWGEKGTGRGSTERGRLRGEREEEREREGIEETEEIEGAEDCPLLGACFSSVGATPQEARRSTERNGTRRFIWLAL
jgi:hypothetical protein